jgi:hypothetical protein
MTDDPSPIDYQEATTPCTCTPRIVIRSHRRGHTPSRPATTPAALSVSATNASSPMTTNHRD